MGSSCQSRLLAEIEAPQRQKSTLESGLPSGFVTQSSPTLGQPVPEGLKPMGRTHIREVHGELSPTAGTPCWSRGRV